MSDNPNRILGDTAGNQVDTVDDGGVRRLAVDIKQTASPHDLGGALHNADTLANLNTKVSDATLIDTGDSRLSDARTPTSHASSHQSGGGDAIKLDDLSAPDDNTDLDATTLLHGLLPKLGGGSTNFLRADGTWNAPPGAAAHDLGGSSHNADTLANLNTKVSDATLDDSSDTRDPNAHNLGGSAHGADTLANLNTKVSDATLIDTGDSRLSDARTPTSHTTSHQSGGGDAIKLDDLAAPDDNTDLDATISLHGLLPKLGGGTTNFLRADGSWQAPPGGTDEDAIHDNVAGEINAVSEKGTPVSGDLILIEDSADSNNKKKVQVGNLPSGSGETNTASNVGTAGVGVYKTKVGVDLQFKKVNAGSAKVTITDDTGNDEVDVDVVTGSDGNSVCIGNDSRLSDARTPTSHASSHQSGGGDAIKLDDLSAPDDNTDLDATISLHGLLPKLGGGSTNFLRADGTWNAPPGGTDDDAIHDNVTGEINAIDDKASPVGADLILIEDSAASYAKKKVSITNLPGGADADAIHDNVSAEISAITEKTTPVSADLLLIEDSAASNAKKRVQIGNLPGGSGGLETKTGTVADTSFSGDPPTYAVVFSTAFPDINYAIQLSTEIYATGTRLVGWGSKATTGFTITVLAATMVGSVDWTAIEHGET